MTKNILRMIGYLLLLSFCGIRIPSCTPPEPQRQLAVAHGNALSIVDSSTQQTLYEVTRYHEVMRLAYRPDGARLAVGICADNRIAELDTTTYVEISIPMRAASCPWAIGYSPDGQSLAGNLPILNDPMGAWFGHLRVVDANPVEKDLGMHLPALAYRPGGQQLAVSKPQELTILGTGPLIIRPRPRSLSRQSA